METKTYDEWCVVFDKENNTKIIDNDGAIALYKLGKLQQRLKRQEAFGYYVQNTLQFNTLKEK